MRTVLGNHCFYVHSYVLHRDVATQLLLMGLSLDLKLQPSLPMTPRCHNQYQSHLRPVFLHRDIHACHMHYLGVSRVASFSVPICFAFMALRPACKFTFLGNVHQVCGGMCVYIHLVSVAGGGCWWQRYTQMLRMPAVDLLTTQVAALLYLAGLFW